MRPTGVWGWVVALERAAGVPAARRSGRGCRNRGARWAGWGLSELRRKSRAIPRCRSPGRAVG